MASFLSENKFKPKLIESVLVDKIMKEQYNNDTFGNKLYNMIYTFLINNYIIFIILISIIGLLYWRYHEINNKRNKKNNKKNYQTYEYSDSDEYELSE